MGQDQETADALLALSTKHAIEGLRTCAAAEEAAGMRLASGANVPEAVLAALELMPVTEKAMLETLEAARTAQDNGLKRALAQKAAALKALLDRVEEATEAC
ncbi:MAG: hypothetical protein JSS66_05530 [Armatimonadetes bacterium]|nr:hypothetical protein [Armatimonadota bacterium]